MVDIEDGGWLALGQHLVADDFKVGHLWPS
jgi:hypothetical protein